MHYNRYNYGDILPFFRDGLKKLYQMYIFSTRHLSILPNRVGKDVQDGGESNGADGCRPGDL